MSKYRNKSNGHDLKEQDICSLQLFVTGATPNSVRAVTNIRFICGKYLESRSSFRYSLKIIDIYKEKETAFEEQLVAVPMLTIKMNGLPLRRLIGDLSNTQKVLEAMGIKDELT